jgi:hypothetical protein
MDGWLNWIRELIQAMFAARTLGVMLWIGLAVLTGTLVVLMRSRWGQVKPIWKCMLLSVLAHILLGGYAWGTKLIFQVDKRSESAAPVSVVVHDPVSENETATSEFNGSQTPWEKFSTEPASSEIASEPEKLSAAFDYTASRPQTEVRELESRKINGQVAPGETYENTNFKPTESNVHQIQNAAIEATPAQPQSRQNDAATEQVQLNHASDIQKIDTNSDLVDGERTFDNQRSVEDIQSRLKSLENGLDSPDSTDNLKSSNLPFDANGNSNPNSSVQSKTPSRNEEIEPNRLSQKTRRLGDGQLLPSVYRNRMPDSRTAFALSVGATVESELAVENALRWLSSNQELDGRWDASAAGAGIENKVLGHDRLNAGAQADTGVTGLALLSFLAAGNTHLEGPYRETVKKGLSFLCASQMSNGSFQGDSRLFAQMYCHSIALLCVSEAYSMTGDPHLKPFVERGVAYSVGAQNRNDGGWRYQPGDLGDMSQFGWQVMALASARNGGINVDDSVFAGMNAFLNSCTSGRHRGLASYRPSEAVSPTMTSEALVCRCFLHTEISDQMIEEATSQINPNDATNGRINFYYWYYATLALHQTGGEKWETWHPKLRDRLVELQQNAGKDSGSWDPNGLWCGYGGRVYSTAMATLSLEIYYRYLPVMRR